MQCSASRLILSLLLVSASWVALEGREVAQAIETGRNGGDLHSHKHAGGEEDGGFPVGEDLLREGEDGVSDVDVGGGEFFADESGEDEAGEDALDDVEVVGEGGAEEPQLGEEKEEEEEDLDGAEDMEDFDGVGAVALVQAGEAGTGSGGDALADKDMGGVEELLNADNFDDEIDDEEDDGAEDMASFVQDEDDEDDMDEGEGDEDFDDEDDDEDGDFEEKEDNAADHGAEQEGEHGEDGTFALV